jgi:hypothetical protein
MEDFHMNTTATTTPSAADELAFMAALAKLGREQLRDLCGKCGGSATRPCKPCRRKRDRIKALYDEDLSLVAIAASVGLPTWRVDQILEQERELADHVSDEDLALEANADLLRPYIGDVVDVFVAGPGRNSAWQFDNKSDWHKWMRWTLEMAGWNAKAVRSVLNGTHIPNAPLRAAVERAKADSGDEPGAMLTSELLGSMVGTTDGTHLDRLLGARPVPASKKKSNGRTYGGNHIQAMSREWAEKIAAALDLAPGEIPGL